MKAVEVLHVLHPLSRTPAPSPHHHRHHRAPSGTELLEMSGVKLPSPLKWRSPWATEKVAAAVDSRGR